MVIMVATTWYFAVILSIMRRLAGRFVHLLAALVVVLSSWLAHAGATVSLATNGRHTAQLICNGVVILNEVYYLRLRLSDGALLISWRESLRSGAPDKVLILTNFGQCQAQETNVPFFGGRFSSY
jgi:hypothetical protein